MGKGTRRFVTIVVLAVIAAGCASDRADDPAAGVATTTAPAADDGRFGDLPAVCGEGDASGATDQGITDDAIEIGYGDDAGFPSAPGLNHQMGDAVEAFVAWCNDLGGINGRRIEATYYDARITEVNNVFTTACPKEFYMVGQGFALDNAQEEVRRGCGLPSVSGFAVSPQFANAPLHHSPNTVPGDYTIISAGAQLAALFPEEIKRSAVVFANYSATMETRDKVVPGFESRGYEFACPQSYNLAGEPDWKPFAQKLKDCGVELVYFIGSPFPNFVNLASAAAQLEVDPIWYVDPNFYDEAFAEWNTDGFADRLYLRSAFTPFEEAEHDEATQQFLDIVEANGGDANQSGQQSASAFLLWATAAKACGSELTRACVEEQLDGIHEWTGGGMHVASDPGANLPSSCGMLLKATGTTFERVVPKEPDTFDCDPSYAFRVTGDVVARARIDENRLSQLE